MSAHRVFLLSLACFTAGIGGGTLRPPELKLLLIGAAAGAALVAFHSFRLIGVALIAAAAGAWYVQAWRQHRWAEYAPGTVTFSGHVDGPPDVRQRNQQLTVIPDGALPGSRGNARAPILVRTNRYPSLRYGELVSVTGKLERPEPFERFNYPLFLEERGMYGVVPRGRVRSTGYQAPFAPWRFLAELRASLENLINRRIPEPESSFLAGILIGSRRSIPASVQQALQETGTSHLVAISGANITVVVGLLLRLLPVRAGWPKTAAVGAIGVGMSLLSGSSASVVRGASVSFLGSGIGSMRRRAWPAPLLLLGAAGMLLVNPLLLVADPGFQLSFAAFAGLLCFSPVLAKAVERWPLTRALPAAVTAAIIETTAATAGTAPFTLLLQGQFSALGLVVNPLVLWLIGPITALGLALLAFGWWAPLGGLIAAPLWYLLRTVLALIGFFARVPGGTYLRYGS